MRRVLFLGAGASVPFGIPLTADILPRIVERLRSDTARRLFSSQFNDAKDEQDDETFVKDGLRALYPGIDLEGSDQNLPYVTEVLSFLDFLIFNGHPARPRLDREGLGRLRKLFDRAICEVLSLPIGWSAPDSQDPAAKIWDRFRGYIKQCVRDVSDHLAVITTNYDLLPDRMLAGIAKSCGTSLTQIDIGFQYREVNRGNLVPRPITQSTDAVTGRLALYKLHGSLNYLQCEVCDQVYLNPDKSIVDLAFQKKASTLNTCHCGHGPLSHVIVAPSSVRSVRVPQILDVWSAATEALRTAQEWIFVGYSMPLEDLAIRSMLLRAWHARGQEEETDKPIEDWEYLPPPEVKVVQVNKQAKPEYALMFGSSHQYFDDGLDDWLQSFEEEIHTR